MAQKEGCHVTAGYHRAWKDEEYRLSLSDAEQALLPAHNDFVQFQTDEKALPEAEVRSVHPPLSEDRFRRRDMLALPAGDDQVLLVCDSARHELVSHADFTLLHGCPRFTTLERMPHAWFFLAIVGGTIHATYSRERNP